MVSEPLFQLQARQVIESYRTHLGCYVVRSTSDLQGFEVEHICLMGGILQAEPVDIPAAPIETRPHDHDLG